MNREAFLPRTVRLLLGGEQPGPVVGKHDGREQETEYHIHHDTRGEGEEGL
jgi:hypothetical protein